MITGKSILVSVNKLPFFPNKSFLVKGFHSSQQSPWIRAMLASAFFSLFFICSIPCFPFKQKHHVTQPTASSSKDKLSTNSLNSVSVIPTSVQRSELNSVEPLHPPPGVSMPHHMNQASSVSSSGFNAVTVSGSGKPVSHTSRLLYAGHLFGY